MKKNILFNTSIGTLNMGDYIIVESCKEHLEEIISEDFLVELPSHTPAVHNYQSNRLNSLIRYTDDAKYKFITGTNLLSYNMLKPWNNLNINIFNYRPYKNLILVGCGIHPNKSNKANFYTKYLYKKVLSMDYIHSTRDERTKIFLENLGFKAINTGCATTWNFTKDFCNIITAKKARDVVFTLTDYMKDIVNDQILINILKNNYENMYFWVQGSNDLNYLKGFKNVEDIKIINPHLKDYKEVLSKDIDFVGTRLHAGIFAMQHKKRTIIIGVDNRAMDMQETYNLNVLHRDQIKDKLETMINSSFETNVSIDLEKINKWKSQFIDEK